MPDNGDINSECYTNGIFRLFLLVLLHFSYIPIPQYLITFTFWWDSSKFAAISKWDSIIHPMCLVTFYQRKVCLAHTYFFFRSLRSCLVSYSFVGEGKQFSLSPSEFLPEVFVIKETLTREKQKFINMYIFYIDIDRRYPSKMNNSG